MSLKPFIASKDIKGTLLPLLTLSPVKYCLCYSTKFFRKL